jgi:hypothetical protein
MVRTLLSVGHRFWLDLLYIYMSVVSGDSFLGPHDVGLRLMSGYRFLSGKTVATVNPSNQGTHSQSSDAAAPLMYLKALRISAL